MPNIHWLQLNI